MTDKIDSARDRLGPVLTHSDRVRKAFNPGSTYWRDFYAKDPEGAERLQIFREALLSVEARGLWLDAGCGIGMLAQQFRDAGLRVCGVDVSEGLLRSAADLTGLEVAEAGPPPQGEHLYRTPVERLPYHDEHFDGVYSASVLEYVVNLELALGELHRVVKRDGHLVFSMPNAFSVFRMLHVLRGRRDGYFDLVPRWAYWGWELTRLLARAGWTPLGSSYFSGGARAPGRLADLPCFAKYVLIVARRT
jgi:SAM-dependent methyltransferase